MLLLKEGTSFEMLQQLAHYLGVTFQRDKDVAEIHLDTPIGKGYIKLIHIFPGICVWVFNSKFEKELTVEMKFSSTGPYYLNYVVQGSHLLKPRPDEEYYKVRQNQNFLLKGKKSSTSYFVLPGGKYYKSCCLTINPEEVVSSGSSCHKNLLNYIDGIVKGTRGEKAFFHMGNINMKANVFAKILINNNVDTGVLGRLKLEGATLNLLETQVSAFNTDTSAPTNKSALTKSELKKLGSLRQFILGNLDRDMSVSLLSEHTRLSPKKIQLGMCMLFNTTANGYITRIRMEHAKELLLSENYNISEICYKIGFSSRSHFSKLFSQYFGVTPSKFKSTHGPNIQLV